MPSRQHEVLIEMFRERPALAADLLAGPLGIAVPEFHIARLSATELPDLAPTEFRADAVVTMDAADAPVFAVVVEVQLGRDPRKRKTWPAYVATLHARLGCPAMLLVISPDPGVASWCAQPIVVTDPGLMLTPVVLGPAEVPVVTDVEVARRNPQLAVLSALAHGGRGDPAPVFGALVAALDVMDHDHAGLYTELVSSALPAAARRWLEEFMTTAAHGFEGFESEFLARVANRVADLRHAEGLAKGQAEGRAEGEAWGEARSLLAVLGARQVQVPDDVRAEILACTDTTKLEAWIRRAATADKIQDVLD